MGELIDEVARLNVTMEDIRQAVVQAMSTLRGTQGDAEGRGSSADVAARAGVPPRSSGTGAGGSGAAAERFGRSLAGGASGLGSFASSEIASSIGGPLGAAAGSAFTLLLKGIGDIRQGGNAAIGATPLFSSRSFVNQSEAFGEQRGFNDFLGKSVGLSNFTSFFERESRQINEAQAHEQTPILRAAGNLAGMARAIAEQGGEGFLQPIKDMIPYEVARQRRGQNAEEIIHEWTTKFAAANPSASNQFRSP